MSQTLSTDEKFVAWHVGRQGEASCGMTQVVNGYVQWPFQHCDISVIEPRDGSSGVKALLPFFQSIKKILALRDPSRQMVVVHLSQGGSFVREGALVVLARMRGFGVVAHLHGSRFVAFASRWPTLVRNVLSSASKIIVLSQATQASVKNLVTGSVIELVPNAVTRGNSVPKEKLVVFGGAVSHRKGVDVLLEAWRRAATGQGWTLKIAGPADPEFKNIEHSQDVEMLGAVSHKTLMELLERSSIAVLPSRNEAMPMFILEAMARRNCVISTRVGGIPDVLGDGSGMLVEPGNVDQLAAAFSTAINDAEQRDAIATAGQKKYEAGYSAQSVYDRLESLWASVLKV